MFEYILLIQVCSVIDNVCLKSTLYPKPLSTHKECVVTGYETGLEIAKSLNTKDTNQKKLFITFSCREVEKLKT